MSSIRNIIGTKYQTVFDPKILKDFRIDDILYKSVYHYIYSNLVHFEIDKKSLNNAYFKDVYIEYLEIETSSRYQIIHDSCEQAIESRFAFGEAADLLVSTGDSILLYTSSNKDLGTGNDMLGKNLYGKMLMKFRTNLRVKREIEIKEKNKEKVSSNLYKIYGVILCLKLRMSKELDDLSDFIGLTVDEIIHKIGKQKIFDTTPSPDTIYSLYESQQIQDKEIIDNPNHIVKLLRKKYIQRINTDINILREKAIVESFVDWLIEYKSVEYKLDLDRTRIKYEQLNNISSSQKERILRLYSEGKLNENVEEQIKERMSIVRPLIPPEDIETANSFEIPVDIDQPEEKPEKIQDSRPLAKIQDSYDNDYFSKLFVKLTRKKTKRDEQLSDEEMMKNKQALLDAEMEKEIFELDKEQNIQDLLNAVTVDSKKAVPIRKKRLAQPIPQPFITTVNNNPVNTNYRPPSTVRFSEDPKKGYFGGLSPLAIDRTVWYASDNYAYPSIYHYIMTRLFEILPTVKTASKAHGYIMSKMDATNVKTYKSFEVLDKEYDELYNIERLIKISELLNRCLPLVLPPIEEIKNMYKGDIDYVYTYNVEDDTLMGNTGYNIYGNELTKFIKSKLQSVKKTEIKEEYKDAFIKKRLYDMCRSVKTVINTSDSARLLTETDILNIIYLLYGPCHEIFASEYVGNVTDEYFQYIRNLLATDQVTDGGVEVIYAFAYNVFTLLQENLNGADIEQYIKSAREEALKPRCVGPYKTKNENCLLAGLIKVVKKLAYLNGRNISSDKLDYVFMLLTNTSEKIDYVDVDDESIPILKSMLASLGESIVNNASSVNGFIKSVSKNLTNDILIRVVFFGI